MGIIDDNFYCDYGMDRHLNFFNYHIYLSEIGKRERVCFYTFINGIDVCNVATFTIRTKYITTIRFSTSGQYIWVCLSHDDCDHDDPSNRPYFVYSKT